MIPVRFSVPWFLLGCASWAGLPAHAHVFLEGEPVTISFALPQQIQASAWRVMDEEGQLVGEEGPNRVPGQAEIDLGVLPVGYYRMEFLDEQGRLLEWTSLAVMAPWEGEISLDSPICADAAIAWFARNDQEKQARFAYLARLAGMNWVRDRMSWGDVEKERGRFEDNTTYDTSAQAQAGQGLRVLQVFHSTPDWAWNQDLDGESPWKRFPRDLRHIHDFCEVMASRYQGQVQAWEPWNEANIEAFGGHLIDEMCSLQKAAFFGLKKGNPDLLVCWNVYAGSGTPLHTEGVLRNQAWPYFETYNIHSYDPVESYGHQFETSRQAASGKPIWITECGIPLPVATEKPWAELSQEDERLQAMFLAKSYAESLWAGVDKHFFFILGNYEERGIQFGLLRHDLTPRPGYLALAAVGRLLHGGVCLGKLTGDDPPGLTCIAFEALPFWKPADVLVVWAKEQGSWELPGEMDVQEIYNHLGRKLAPQDSQKIPVGKAPCFLVLERGSASTLSLDPRKSVSPPREGHPCPVVMQTLFPESVKRLNNQAYRVKREGEMELALYHFGEEEVKGSITVKEIPDGWSMEIQNPNVRLRPRDRLGVTCSFVLPASDRKAVFGDWIELEGDFKEAGIARLAFRLCLQEEDVRASQAWDLPQANEPHRWRDNIVAGSSMSHAACPEGSVLFDMMFEQGDLWAYPILDLSQDERPGEGVDGIRFTVQVLEGKGTVRVQFVEEGGAHYVADTTIQSENRQSQTVTVLLKDAVWGSFSKPDESQRLEASSIRSFMIGINPKESGHVRMAVKDLSWVRY